MKCTPDNATHISVLLNEVLDALEPRENARFLDGTLGLAGHSNAIMEKSGGKAYICGLDRDPQALARAGERLAVWGEHCRLFESDFASFENVMPKLNWPPFDGVLLDLGVSSLQIDVAERGFSLHANGPLSMRMDLGFMQRPEAMPHTESARAFVNYADMNTLRRVIEEYGEDPQAMRIAKAIVDARSAGSIETTKQLADIIYNAYPPKWRATARNHPATRTFQAIRMAVNDELGQLSRFLDAILPYVADNGVIAIISFHSLEDRIVKQTFRRWASDCICPSHLPVCTCHHKAEVEILTKKPIVPTADEVALNPRASSAKLRVVRKLPKLLEERS